MGTYRRYRGGVPPALQPCSVGVARASAPRPGAQLSPQLYTKAGSLPSAEVAPCCAGLAPRPSPLLTWPTSMAGLRLFPTSMQMSVRSTCTQCSGWQKTFRCSSGSFTGCPAGALVAGTAGLQGGSCPH